MIDPHIALQYRPPVLDNPLQTAGQALTLKQLMLQNQTGEQSFSDTQRLRELFKSQGAVDQNTGLPTAEGMAGVYGIDPMIGMKMSQLQQTGELQRAQIKGAALTQENQRGEIDDRTKKNLTQAHTNQTNAFISAYDLAINHGASPEDANKAANIAWSTQLDQDKANGLMKGITPEAEAQVRARPRNIEELRPLVTTPKDVLAANEKKIADERAMMLPMQKAQAARAELERQGKKGSREWKDLNDLIAKEKAPTTMMLYGQNPLTDATARLLAEQRVAGDTSATVGLARNPVALAKVNEQIAQIAKERGYTGKDLAAFNAEFMGTKAGERTLGTRSANIEMAVAEAQNVMPIARDASAKVDRTKYPTLNALLLAAQKGTGDQNVVRLATATNALINIYSRAIAPSGVPTISDKDHARDIIANAYSQGQYEAVLNIMEQEMSAARMSPGQVKEAMRKAITGEGDTTDPISGATVRPMTGTGDGQSLQFSDPDKEKRYQEWKRQYGK